MQSKAAKHPLTGRVGYGFTTPMGILSHVERIYPRKFECKPFIITYWCKYFVVVVLHIIKSPLISITMCGTNYSLRMFLQKIRVKRIIKANATTTTRNALQSQVIMKKKKKTWTLT